MEISLFSFKVKVILRSNAKKVENYYNYYVVLATNEMLFIKTSLTNETNKYKLYKLLRIKVIFSCIFCTSSITGASVAEWLESLTQNHLSLSAWRSLESQSGWVC